MRHLFIQVTAEGGGGAVAGVGNPDFPWSLLQGITLLDVNGAPLFGPIDGYAALWANIAGGYAFNQDPRVGPGFSSNGNNPSFCLRVPVEISHFDGLGSLANQNAAASYKLQLAIASIAQAYNVAPSVAPTLTIKVWLEAWSLPNEVDVAGRPQAQLPPAHGTSQYWSSRRQDVLTGDNTVQLTRVGNLIRNIIFISRDVNGVRDDTVFPDPVILSWDARQLLQESQYYRRRVMHERLVDTARDVGVWVYGFTHSVHNRAGDETPNLWLPTVQSTRLEMTGNNTKSGSVQVVTNDIAPVEVMPSERYVDDSATGFRPNAGAAPPQGR
jgi:hypothetical protein